MAIAIGRSLCYTDIAYRLFHDSKAKKPKSGYPLFLSLRGEKWGFSSGERVALARNQYAKDYRLIETVDAKGRIHTDYEYIGPEYYFQQSPRQVRRELGLRLLLCLAGWVCFVAAMVPDSRSMRTVYVSLPFAFTALPLALTTGVVFQLRRAPQPMEHRFAHKLENRYPPAALAWTLLPGLSAVCSAAGWLAGAERNGGDGVFLVCALLTALWGCLCFLGRRRLTAEKRA